MNKKITFFIFIILVSIFVYPSYRLPGVDCIAGCAMPKGFPLQYSILHGSGVVGGSSKEFILANLIIDLLFWFVIAILVSLIISKLINRFKKL
jgi:hypothetical protein